MKLLYAPASPFSAKVRMAARVCDIAMRETVVDARSEPVELTSVNPLGKIPAIVLDDGRTLFGSSVICDYLDRLSGNRIVPQTDREWFAARRMEMLADGVTEALVLVIYEDRFRPDDKRHAPWVERQWRKANRGLETLAAELDGVSAEPDIGHLSLAALVGWMQLRFADRLERDNRTLKNWSEDFFAAFPTLAEAKPHG